MTKGHAQNPNAYLLFYRRRTDRPLGGKTHEKIASSGSQTDGVWRGPGSETKTISPKYTAVRPASPEQTDKQGGLFDHITNVTGLSGYQSWGNNSPQSTPPALEEQPMALINELTCVDFPGPVHDTPIICHSNPPSPPSDGGYKEGTMTQESMDRWARSVNAKFTEGSSDSVRPSPPSSLNGDDTNPFQAPEDDGLEPVSMDNYEMGGSHSTLNDIDI